ncbi:MAG: sigma-70 family RNA polymerase sigma factor [Lachnospiraceae bacterium]|nr:sigma-70 family RNA polymerase sigma factor [Lachnospiraceae bacterium]
MSEEAFRRLYVETNDRVRRFIKSQVREEDVEDLVQEVFALAWEKREIIGGYDRPAAWLMKTARFKVMEQRRKYRRSMAPLENLEWKLGRKAAGQEMAEMVYFLDAYLSPREMRFFLAIYLEGMTLEEMARIEGVSKECMRLRMERQKKLLRDGLAKNLKDKKTE